MGEVEAWGRGRDLLKKLFLATYPCAVGDVEKHERRLDHGRATTGEADHGEEEDGRQCCTEEDRGEVCCAVRR